MFLVRRNPAIFGFERYRKKQERKYLHANTNSEGGHILLQTRVTRSDDTPTEVTARCVMEIAGADHNPAVQFVTKMATLHSSGHEPSTAVDLTVSMDSATLRSRRTGFLRILADPCALSPVNSDISAA